MFPAEGLCIPVIEQIILKKYSACYSGVVLAVERYRSTQWIIARYFSLPIAVANIGIRDARCLYEVGSLPHPFSMYSH